MGIMSLIKLVRGRFLSSLVILHQPHLHIPIKNLIIFKVSMTIEIFQILSTWFSLSSQHWGQPKLRVWRFPTSACLFVWKNAISKTFIIRFTSFDNLLWSMLTTFQLITLDYWENVYNMVRCPCKHHVCKHHVRIHRNLYVNKLPLPHHSGDHFPPRDDGDDKVRRLYAMQTMEKGSG